MPELSDCPYSALADYKSYDGYHYCQYHFDGCCQHPDVPLETVHNREREQCRMHDDHYFPF